MIYRTPWIINFETGISLDQRFSDNYSGLGFKGGIGVGYANAPWIFIPFKYSSWGSFPKNEIVSVPLQLNYLFGKGNSQFEAGAGVINGHKKMNLIKSPVFAIITCR